MGEARGLAGSRAARPDGRTSSRGAAILEELALGATGGLFAAIAAQLAMVGAAVGGGHVGIGAGAVRAHGALVLALAGFVAGRMGPWVAAGIAYVLAGFLLTGDALAPPIPFVVISLSLSRGLEAIALGVAVGLTARYVPRKDQAGSQGRFPRGVFDFADVIWLVLFVYGLMGQAVGLFPLGLGWLPFLFPLSVLVVARVSVARAGGPGRVALAGRVLLLLLAAWIFERVVGRTRFVPWWTTHVLLFAILARMVWPLRPTLARPARATLAIALVLSFLGPWMRTGLGGDLWHDTRKLRIGMSVPEAVRTMRDHITGFPGDGDQEIRGYELLDRLDRSDEWRSWNELAFGWDWQSADWTVVELVDGRVASIEMSPD